MAAGEAIKQLLTLIAEFSVYATRDNQPDLEHALSGSGVSWPVAA